VMDSCGETYRLARWHAIDEHHIERQEDTARIEAKVMQVSSRSRRNITAWLRCPSCVPTLAEPVTSGVQIEGAAAHDCA